MPKKDLKSISKEFGFSQSTVRQRRVQCPGKEDKDTVTALAIEGDGELLLRVTQPRFTSQRAKGIGGGDLEITDRDL